MGDWKERERKRKRAREKGREWERERKNISAFVCDVSVNMR